jgi:dTDP-L-rhamnose 4-epimerase
VKALVTGGAGFIGSHIAEALLREGIEVVVLDSLEPRVHSPGMSAFFPDGARLIQGDVRDKSAWELALEGVDYVFHQAAYQDYMTDYSKFFHTNVVGTALLYEVLGERKRQVQKVVVASSQAVYGEGQYECAEHGPILPAARSRDQMVRGDWEVKCPHCGIAMKPKLLDERFPNPYNQYALSKYGQETAAIRLGQKIGVPTVALRYSIVQGPRQSPFNAYSGVCRIFTVRLMNEERPVIYEDGNQLRDYCHIDDVVAANLLVLREPRADFEAFNVGGGEGTTVREYADQLARVVGTEVRPLIPGKFRVGDNRHSVSSVAKLGALGWSPRKGLQQIMRDYWEWLRETGMMVSFDGSADADMENKGVVCAAIN